jgi:predicted PurR-regulated permease PerM
MVRIVDGAFGSFVRSQILLGVAVGIATYVGFWALETYAGMTVGNYKLVFAVLSGLLQLIPGVGPWVNTIATVALAYATRSTSAAVQVLALYVAIQLVVARFISNRSGPQLLDVHPAILILVIVALSQLGILWAFLAAPIAATARDLWRYLYGRASEPPLPAGLLPSQREAYFKQAAAAQTAAARPIPAVYRRR